MNTLRTSLRAAAAPGSGPIAVTGIPRAPTTSAKRAAPGPLASAGVRRPRPATGAMSATSAKRAPLGSTIAATLTDADEALLQRLVEGSARHAARRAEEMAAARAMLEELGVEPRVAAASETWLRSLSAADG